MIIHFHIFGHQFYFHIVRVRRVHGFISLLKVPHGQHILMWDFDNLEEPDVRQALVSVQRQFSLPHVYYWPTGRDGSWHAVCLEPFLLPEAALIILSTPGIDRAYVALSIMRGYFTLRYTPKGGEEPGSLRVIYGDRPPSLDWRDIQLGVSYFTIKL